jgi:hypothetical protein
MSLRRPVADEFNGPDMRVDAHTACSCAASNHGRQHISLNFKAVGTARALKCYAIGMAHVASTEPGI